MKLYYKVTIICLIAIGISFYLVNGRLLLAYDLLLIVGVIFIGLGLYEGFTYKRKYQMSE